MADQTLEWRQHQRTAILASMHGWPDSELRRHAHLAATDGYLSAGAYLEYYSARIGTDDPAPTPTCLTERHGGWTRAVEAVGLRPGEVNRSYTRRSQASMVAGVVAVADALGTLPSIAEYRAYRAAHPELGLACEALIRRRFAGWLGVLESVQSSANREREDL